MEVFISCLKIVFKQVVNVSTHLFSFVPNLQLSEEDAEEEGAVRFKGDDVWWVLTEGVSDRVPLALRPRGKETKIAQL